MSKIRNKMKKQGGFTLIEMLVVVAIIAILVAVSIPIMTNVLERTRQATDAANERAAKAEGTIYYLQHEYEASKTDDYSYAYDMVSGNLIGETHSNTFETANAPKVKYGKCKNKNHADQYIVVHIDYSDGKVTLEWSGGSGNHDSEINDTV